MADDDILTGSGEPLAPPSDAPEPQAPVDVPDVPSRSEAVKETFKAGLNLTAFGTESAEDYVKEREVQDRFNAGEDISPAQMQEWHERTTTALQRAIDAQARARGEVPPSQQQSTEAIPGYIPPDDPNYEQHIEANRIRFGEYFDNPANIGDQLSAYEHKKAVTDWITTYDPKSVLVGHFMASPLGPQMMEALEGQPQIITYLANLPPQIRAGEMKKFEGYLAAKEEMKQQNGYESRGPEPRRETHAPPIIRPPRGGANPPSDLHQLAARGDVKDYVRARMKMERNRDD
jgi:hypothetical protein